MKRRSSCPISFALDIFGDRWTLLVVRDLALKGRHSFAELLDAGEGIATNVLSDRLSRLQKQELVKRERDPDDGRRYHYGLTDKGKDLLPVLVELIAWSAKHDPLTAAPASFVQEVNDDRAALLQRLREEID
ncbi:MAG: winged helix-turn-helix transcriptional regulator [Sandaracinaceae bacterium]